jgi:GxxExxY protein
VVIGCDLVVETDLIVEVKAVERILPVHMAQLLSYLRISGSTRGLLLNFHETLMKNGVRRAVNKYRPPAEGM